MATTLNPPAAFTDASGNIISIDFTGTSDDCNDLRIEVADANTGDLLFAGPVVFNGNNWSKSFTAPEDFLSADILCDKDLDIKLKCRDTNPSQELFSGTETVKCNQNVDCTITIDSAEGIAANSGLQQLTIKGTASCSTVKIHLTSSNGTQLSRTGIPVAGGQWQASFTQGEADVSTNLKDYHCKEVISIEIECVNDKSCAAKADLEIICGDRKCPDTAEVIVTGPDGFNKTNPTDEELQCLPPGNYTIKCTTAANSYQWRSNDTLVTGPNSSLQVVSVNADTMVIDLASGDNLHFSVSAQVSADCEPMRTVAFHCGGGTDPGSPGRRVDCVVSAWSDWGPCRNNEQIRTRTVITRPRNGGRICPPLIQTRDCRTTVAVDCVVSGWSRWSKCRDGRQHRTRTIITQPANGGRICPPNLRESRECTDIVVNLCLIWMFINLGLLIITAVLIFVAFCAIGADTWAAIGTIGTAGGLAPIFATLSAAVIALLIAAAIAAAITLLSFILWIIFCLFMSLKDRICELIDFILLVLHTLMAISFILGVVLAIIAAATAGSTLGCAAGAFVDLGWFTIFEQIFFWIGVFTGCIRPLEIFGLFSRVKK